MWGSGEVSGLDTGAPHTVVPKSIGEAQEWATIRLRADWSPNERDYDGIMNVQVFKQAYENNCVFFT